MRILFALPLLLLAPACDVDNDPANNQVTLQYDENQFEAAGNTAENVAEDVGNAAENAGQTIQNAVGDVDVDVDVDRNEPANAQ